MATVAVVGAGPAGLMAAEVAAAAGAEVTVYERMPSPGRKLLLAGRGGLNLTHSEDPAAFRARYGAAATALAPALDGFGPEALRAWCADLGIETFVGTSGRVFPVSFKTSPLLRAWLRRLDAAGVRLRTRHRWLGWDGADRLRFAAPGGLVGADPDATVLALGGATWPQLGSDGTWLPVLAAHEVAVATLRPANCGFAVPWSPAFRERFEGHVLKGVKLAAADGQSARGDVVIARDGIEGGPVYALAAPLRDLLEREGEATITVSLRPDLDHGAVTAHLARRRSKDSFGNALRKALALSPAAVALLREDPTVAALDPAALAARIGAVPLRLTAPMPLAGAISTAGGVRFDALADAGPMLRARPGTFVAGEMLDWEAPTGGYLLTASLATGRAAGQGAVDWLARQAAA